MTHQTVLPHSQVSIDPNHTLKGLAVYHDAKPVGNVFAVLVDDLGRLQYLIVDRKSGFFGRRVLLSADRIRPDPAGRIDIEGLSKRQIADLPEFTAAIGKGRYRLTIRRMAAVEESMALEAADRLVAVARGRLVETERAIGLRPNVEPEPMETTLEPAPEPIPEPIPESVAVEPPDSAAPAANDLTQATGQTLRLYEERLVADKHLEKVGEVDIYKRVETQTTRFAVSIAKERIVIAHFPSRQQGQIAPGARLQAGEVLRWDIYEETVDLQKQPVVREVVNIRKQTQQEVMQLEEPVRREVLDVQTQGHPIVETGQSLLSPRSSQ